MTAAFRIESATYKGSTGKNLLTVLLLLFERAFGIPPLNVLVTVTARSVRIV